MICIEPLSFIHSFHSFNSDDFLWKPKKKWNIYFDAYFDNFSCPKQLYFLKLTVSSKVHFKKEFVRLYSAPITKYEWCPYIVFQTLKLAHKSSNTLLPFYVNIYIPLMPGFDFVAGH